MKFREVMTKTNDSGKIRNHEMMPGMYIWWDHSQERFMWNHNEVVTQKFILEWIIGDHDWELVKFKEETLSDKIGSHVVCPKCKKSHGFTTSPGVLVTIDVKKFIEKLMDYIKYFADTEERWENIKAKANKILGDDIYEI